MKAESELNTSISKERSEAAFFANVTAYSSENWEFFELKDPKPEMPTPAFVLLFVIIPLLLFELGTTNVEGRVEVDSML